MISFLTNMVKSVSGGFLLIPCIGVFTGILLFGLWPLGYRIPNKVKFIDNEGGIHFLGDEKRFKLEAGGVAYSNRLLNSIKKR